MPFISEAWNRRPSLTSTLRHFGWRRGQLTWLPLKALNLVSWTTSGTSEIQESGHRQKQQTSVFVKKPTVLHCFHIKVVHIKLVMANFYTLGKLIPHFSKILRFQFIVLLAHVYKKFCAKSVYTKLVYYCTFLSFLILSCEKPKE